MYKKILFLMLLFPLSYFSSGQDTLKIDGIAKQGFRGVKTIMDKANDKVIGHYLYYKQGYQLAVDLISPELELQHHIDLNISRRAEIEEGVFNGHTFMFLVSEPGRGKAFTISQDGQVIAEKQLTYSYSEDDPTAGISIFPCAFEDCFYIVLPASKGYKKGYTVQKVDKSFKVLWENQMLGRDNHYSVEAAQSGAGRFVIIQKRKPTKLFNNDVYAELLCFDSYNGDTLFLSPLYDANETFTALPSQIVIDAEQNIIAAGEYFAGLYENQVSSQGVFIKKISPAGEELIYNKLDWKDGIQEQLRKTKVRISLGKNKVFFHDLIATEEGGYQVIGETFSASKMGALIGEFEGEDNELLDFLGALKNSSSYLAAYTSGRYIGELDEESTASKLITQDIIILNFDRDLEITAVKKIGKAYTKVYIYPPSTYLGGLELAQTVADYGFFDYAFHTFNPQTRQRTVVYNANYSPKNPHIGAADITAGALPEVKKIPFRDLDIAGKKRRRGRRDEAKRGQAGVVRAADGKMLVFFFVADDNKKYHSGAVYMYLDDFQNDER